MGWKYVMFENTTPTGIKILVPVVFPDLLIHKDIAQLLSTIMPSWQDGSVKAVSAGKIEHIEVDVLGGGSTTLKLKSKPGDKDVIDNYSYKHGIMI